MIYELKSVTTDVSRQLYHIKAESIREYVEPIWGWDEGYQKNDFDESLKMHDVFAIMVEHQVAGMLELWEDEHSISIVEIHLSKEYRGQKIGKHIIENIKQQAAKSKKAVIIGCFKRNSTAKAIYQRLGFVHINTSNHHHEFVYLPESALCYSKVANKQERRKCYDLIIEASSLVSHRLGITKENCPSFTGFMDFATYSSKVNRTCRLYVIKYKSLIIGTGCLDTKEMLSPTLRYIAINPSFQSKGFGKLLVKYLENLALEEGAKSVGIGAIKENKSLIEWYEKLGFKPSKTRALTGKTFHALVMRKDLR